MYNRKSLAALLLLTGAGIVIACGPEFPAQLLDDRAATLRATPANSFGYEAARLVGASDTLQAQEAYELPDGSYQQNALPEDRDPALTPAQRVTTRAMRAQPDGEQAYALGAGLPEALRLYTAAAVDTHAARGADTDRLLEQARARYRAILQLPPQQAAARSVWAAYMLAEIGDEAELAASDADAQRQAAAQAYARARQLARDGAPDPLGLAVASYGQEARLFLAGPQGQCSYMELVNAEPCMDAIPAASLKHALRRYAEQAARDSASGNASLRMLAQWALDDPARTRKLIDDPVAQRLLVAYALARVGDIVDGRPDSATDPYAAYDTTGQAGFADAAQGHEVTPNPALQSLVAALETQDLKQVLDADRVAALAYRIGRYDLAQTLAARLDTGLAWWVRAKLALRQGDTQAAAQAYAQAASAFPRADGSVEGPSAARLLGEQGVLTLSRGQYVEALDQLLHATVPDRSVGGFWQSTPYWNDAAYVAERVLTTPELKAYVDRHAPAAAAAVGSAPPDPQHFYKWLEEHPVTASDRLRLLLARRLVREGSIAQALPYFPADSDARYVTLDYVDGKLELRQQRSRQLAAEYGAALRKAGSAWGRTTRAEAWFGASRLARRDGMEIMGYEQEPDFATYGGNTAYGAGRSAVPGSTAADGTDPPDTPALRAAAALPGPFVTEEERRRYAASEAQPYTRFHYRQIAANHALRAADELPRRSQAFAAVLCQGTRYIIDDSPEQASAIYRRYIEQGAQVPFSGSFGRECAAPDFQAAAWFHYTQAEKSWERLRRNHPGLLLAAALLALVGGGAAVLAWRYTAARPNRTERRS
ncbi:tetratricopeptide repeat family protein 3 [Achromobacter xylosoxidans A8]|uniref:Tetratricopeptide repeat family protein 3 n=1 Tax=Achromobacter xylosoxidans (strain A8) TaxID=762376 RepID=E3HEC4_ACHXA|nr:hypothetical protein [Achromobacter xylosoxidans]ADP14034.1 tetratricopeptide repeat family protein 3 [Achromobacter xylosoxidans A8]